MATFIIYSHTDSKDIWSLLSEKIKLIDDVHEKIIAINDDSADYFIDGFNRVVKYNDSFKYSDKLLQVFEKIETIYIVLIHDNDVIIKFNNKLFESLLQSCTYNNIDLCMFHVGAVDSNEKIKVLGEDIIGCVNDKKSPHVFLPYNVGPTIWKMESYKKALLAAPSTGYREIETSSVRDYCKDKLRAFAFLANPAKKSMYVIGRPFYYDFQFLHMFCGRKMMKSHLYMDQEDNFVQIVEKYPAIKLRGILTGQDHININFKTM